MSALPNTPVRRGELPSPPQILEPLWVRGVLIAVALVVGIDGIARSRRRKVPVSPAARWLMAGWTSRAAWLHRPWAATSRSAGV